MSWRTVVISNRCKLDLSMGYMVIRGEETMRVFLDEIAVLVIENCAVSLTGCLLSALTEKKVKVIFCDEKRNPSSELIPYSGSYDNTKKIRNQMSWTTSCKGAVWEEIIAQKIANQEKHLHDLGLYEASAQLREYISQIQFNDETNREGHAAKVYFNAIFGTKFSRGKECPINAALNYGYSLLLSLFNREIVMNGYLTQIGIHHDNVFNAFNLSSDLMEPFRILVDRAVVLLEPQEFMSNEKREMLHILESEVKIANTVQILPNAVKIYVRSVFEALNQGEISLIQFAEI